MRAICGCAPRNDIASYDIGGDKIAFHLADGGLYGHILSIGRMGCGSSGTVQGATVCYPGGENQPEENPYTFPGQCVFHRVKTRKDAFGLRWLIGFATLAADGSSLAGMHRAAFRFS